LQPLVFMKDTILYLIPLLGVVGLIVMAIKSAWVSKQDAGDDNMQRLAGFIARGAMAFLRAEWKILSYFVVIAAILLAWSGTFKGTEEHPIHSSPIMFCLLLLDILG
jgi:K(+)-stimulated pyrophosphate-energized sodium pump